jgi:hypothetical protein
VEDFVSHLPNRAFLSSRLLLSVALFLAAVSCANAESLRVLNIFLIQNSGWMEPFYVDGNSQFKPLIETVIRKVNVKGGEVVVASFNQSAGDNRSPLLAYRGKNEAEIIKAVRGIQLAKKPGERTFADTDFKEALYGAITQYSSGRPCVLWIFTNNRNSPGNSPETAVKNKEFYKWLRSEEGIKRILAYPHPMPVKGLHYSASGLMVYAIAYGKPANSLLESLIAAELPFRGQPARLKPLDADAITFVPTGVANKGNFSVGLADDQSTLVLQFDSSNRPEVAVINGVFRNDFYPYDIASATVSMDVRFLGESHGIRSAIEPLAITSVTAGKRSTAFAVSIGVPPLPGIWSHPEIIFKSGYQAEAIMTFRLANQKLRLSQDFTKRMNGLFPGDPLPEIFVPGESARQSVSVRPLVVKVAYPIWPLIVLVLFMLIVVAGGAWLTSAVTKPKKYTILVDGKQKTYTLKAFGASPLYSDRGDKIGMLRRGLGKPAIHLESGCDSRAQVL